MLQQCEFCGDQPKIVPIKVFYKSPRKTGLHQMFRAQCDCGAISKCRPSADAAVDAWNEPWQAMVL